MIKQPPKGLNYFLQLIKTMVVVGNLRIAKHILNTGLSCKKTIGENGGKYLLFPEIDLSIHPVKHHFILKTIRNIHQLNRSIGCNIERYGDDILIDIDGWKFYVKTAEDIYFLCETFGQNIYNVILPSKSVVMDIGMNIADSSIYFAAKENVVLVRAFEPFTPTFEMAIRNIKLNPKVATIIEPYNYGLGSHSCRLKCEYSPACKGSVGTTGFVKNAKKNVKNKHIEEIEIKSVAEEITKMKKDFPDCKLVLKIDCEGSEFEIIKNLAAENLLFSISVFLIEWHDKSPIEIIQTLKESKFTVLLADNMNQNIGMLYAFK